MELAYAKSAHETGRRIAKSRRKHRRSYVFDDFWWTGKCSFQEGDKMVQVVKEIDGRRFVDPPADVLYRRTWHRANKPPITFVYYEHPDKRRVRLEKLAGRLGYGAKKRLSRGGIVRNPALSEKLLAAWS